MEFKTLILNQNDIGLYAWNDNTFYITQIYWMTCVIGFSNWGKAMLYECFGIQSNGHIPGRNPNEMNKENRWKYKKNASIHLFYIWIDFIQFKIH